MTSSSNRPATNTVTTDDSETTAPALDLSFTKIAGGALAAVTTAVAASFLGVNGTLTGAAFGSVVSSVAAALYAASLKTAHTRIRTTRTVVTGQGLAGGADPQDPSTLPAELTGRSAALPGETMVMPTPEGVPSAGSVPPYPGQAPSPPHRGRGIRWKSVAVMTGVVFVTAMAAIFATEVVIGHPISNSQETGTSVGRAVQVDVAPATRTSRSSSTKSSSSSESASPSTTTGSLSPTDSASVSPGETTSGDAGVSQPTNSTDPGQTGQTGPTGQTGQGGQGQPQPAYPTGSVAAGSAATNGAAVPTATP